MASGSKTWTLGFGFSYVSPFELSTIRRARRVITSGMMTSAVFEIQIETPKSNLGV